MSDKKTTRVDGLPEGTLKTAIRRRLQGFSSGATIHTYRTGLCFFAEWLADERGITGLREIEVLDCRRYAQHLRKCVRDGKMTGASAGPNGTYFTTVRAFLEWCVKDERIDRNPCKPLRVREELPEETEEADRQFWTKEKRSAFLSYLDERAHDALDSTDTPGVAVREAFRDRAFAYTLALTGVRGAEVLRTADDQKRDGLMWRDVDTEQGVIVVLGKARKRQPTQLPMPAAERMERYRRLVDPADGDWPVFSTYHKPTLSRRLRDAVDDGRADELIARHGIFGSMHVAEVPPPSLTTDGGRDLLKRLCNDSGIKIDGEYLKPHGARRGLGHQLYTEGKAELAQDVLRHTDIRTTHESYKEAKVMEDRQRVEEILDGE